MDLVGMASKPLHVRRLQKALHEWLQNPGEGDRSVRVFSCSTTDNFTASSRVKRPYPKVSNLLERDSLSVCLFFL